MVDITQCSLIINPLWTCSLLWERKSFWCITSCSLIGSQFITGSDWDLALKRFSHVFAAFFCRVEKNPVRKVYPLLSNLRWLLSHCAFFFGNVPLLPHLHSFCSILSSAVPIPSHQFQGLMISRFLSPHHYRIVSYYFSSHCMSSLLDFWALSVSWARLDEQWYT